MEISSKEVVVSKLVEQNIIYYNKKEWIILHAHYQRDLCKMVLYTLYTLQVEQGRGRMMIGDVIKIIIEGYKNHKKLSFFSFPSLRQMIHLLFPLFISIKTIVDNGRFFKYIKLTSLGIEAVEKMKGKKNDILPK